MTPVKDLLAKETQVILRNTCARWVEGILQRTILVIKTNKKYCTKQVSAAAGVISGSISI